VVGANEVGLFYPAMRRGLDFLWENPSVDRNRIGVTGLPGGGWQTIVLSALDERLGVSIRVAGYASLEGRLALAPVTEAGDLEQNSTDFGVGQDYSTLTAMRAPRPTLLIDNAEDDCCFRAPLGRRRRPTVAFCQSSAFVARRARLQLLPSLSRRSERSGDGVCSMCGNRSVPAAAATPPRSASRELQANVGAPRTRVRAISLIGRCDCAPGVRGETRQTPVRGPQILALLGGLSYQGGLPVSVAGG
jgi:hypothetical protein